jgi:acyl-CoA hydrolase
MSGERVSGYLNRPVSAAEAVSMIRPGSRVFIGSACATPRALVDALERLPRPPEGVELIHFLTDHVGVGDPPVTKYRHRVFYIGRDVQALLESGQVEFLPLSIADVPRLIQSGRIQLDVAMVQVAPPIQTENAAWAYLWT